MNKRVVLGVVLATLAFWMWGFLYWVVNPLPYQSLTPVADEAAAGDALRRHFPDEGTYLLPQPFDGDELAERFEAGPIAFVHMTSVGGRPQMEPLGLVAGFVLDLVLVLVIAWLMGRLIGCLPTYGSRIVLCLAIGLVVVLFANVGNVVYWYLPVGWQLHMALYYLTSMLVVGLVLGRFIGPRTP